MVRMVRSLADRTFQPRSRARLPGAAGLPAAALAAVPLGLYLQFRVIPAEERHLKAKHGEAYTSYVARTPRWLFM